MDAHPAPVGGTMQELAARPACCPLAVSGRRVGPGALGPSPLGGLGPGGTGRRPAKGVQRMPLGSSDTRFGFPGVCYYRRHQRRQQARRTGAASSDTIRANFREHAKRSQAAASARQQKPTASDKPRCAPSSDATLWDRPAAGRCGRRQSQAHSGSVLPTATLGGGCRSFTPRWQALCTEGAFTPPSWRLLAMPVRPLATGIALGSSSPPRSNPAGAVRPYIWSPFARTRGSTALSGPSVPQRQLGVSG